MANQRNVIFLLFNGRWQKNPALSPFQKNNSLGQWTKSVKNVRHKNILCMFFGQKQANESNKKGFLLLRFAALICRLYIKG
jgi:hypothetical protein